MMHIVSLEFTKKIISISMDDNLEYNISKKQMKFLLYLNKQGLFGNSVSWEIYVQEYRGMMGEWNFQH